MLLCCHRLAVNLLMGNTSSDKIKTNHNGDIVSTPIKSRISRIDNEVKQLHPLLDVIFRKMSSLIKVEYTHGPNERGADFILTKRSEELGDTEYIGVIVKVGKITQNISSISEQVEECTMRRIASNGKKEIYLSEIWVVANNTISTNAKEKIYEKYKTQKIKFLDINTLGDLAERYVPNYGVDVDLSDANFLARQKELCIEREQKFSLLPKERDSDFIKQEIVKIEDDFSSSHPISNFIELVVRNRFISIESQMGGGKTKLLNNIVEHLSSLEVYKEKRISPLYVSGRDVLYSDDSLLQIVESRVEEYNLIEDDRRKFLVLIDGVDEANPKQDSVSEKLVSLIEEASVSENIKLIIASRDISNNIVESSSIFRSNRYNIKPLKLNGMVRFLETLCEGVNLRNRLLEDLKKSELFKILPKTPIAAIILAKLISEGSEELPMNLTELYSKYCELSLGRWDVDKGLKTQKQYEALDVIVSKIAGYMLDNSLPCLSKLEAKDIFKDYLSARNLKLDSDELFDEMLERSGILVEDYYNGSISFKHRSFAEFFYAKWLGTKQNVEITEKILHPYWTNSYFFYVGLKKDCPELLEEIIEMPITHEGARVSRIINMGNFLLAGYQSPYQIIEKGVNKVFIDLGDYYHEIFEEKKDSFLSMIPPIHLLSFFNGIIEYNYNYKFLEESIVKAVEDNATKSCFGGGNPYTLFFLDSIRYKMGADSLFDNVIDLYGDKLPVVVALAVGHESDRFDYNSAAIKKSQKRIMKSRKRSRDFNEGVIRLYNESTNGKVTF